MIKQDKSIINIHLNMINENEAYLTQLKELVQYFSMIENVDM